MINITGVCMSVVITEYSVDGSLGVSARSDGTVNVQIIMEELGGGGHQTVAGVQLKNTGYLFNASWRFNTDNAVYSCAAQGCAGQPYCHAGG